MAAVIRRDGRILIAKRADNAHQGGLWEFPGGKLEPGEDRCAGLERELREELGIEVTSARPFIDIRHDYPDKSIRLDVWLVEKFTGEAHGAEGQPVRWVQPDELEQYEFPKANAPIVTAAKLPERYLITPDHLATVNLASGLERARAQGITLVQLRQTELSPRDYQRLSKDVLERFGTDFMWILKGSSPPPGSIGWHLTSSQLKALHQAGWCKGERRESAPFAAGPPLLPDSAQQDDGICEQPHGSEEREAWTGLLAASCHGEQELKMAANIGADFVTLSPVLPTRSHPGARPLGWQEAARLIALTNLPVYLLGGLSTQHLDQAFQAGAQGIAGISGLWSE